MFFIIFLSQKIFKRSILKKDYYDVTPILLRVNRVIIDILKRKDFHPFKKELKSIDERLDFFMK